MRCEYCDSIFDDEIILDTCPNCGGVFSEEAESVKIPDEEKRRRLQASGVKYCPHCLSTNVTKTPLFRESGCLSVFIISIVAAISCFTIAPWVVLIPILIWLLERMITKKLVCKDCKLEWNKMEAGDYEKYYTALHVALQGKPEMLYAGVNTCKLKMGISSLTIGTEKQTKLALYRNIAAVEHREPAGDVFGYLSVRDTFNKNVPFPHSYEDAVKDPMTILYESSQVDKYRKVYTALQQIAQINSYGA